MKIRLNRLVVVVAPLLLSWGCTTWRGHGIPECQTKKIVLEGDNFKINKSTIQASASCAYLFPFAGLRIMGIDIIPGGGIALGDPELYKKAYEQLRAQAAMKGKSAQILNVTEERTVRGFLFIGDLTLTLTADVIEFTDEYKDYRQR